MSQIKLMDWQRNIYTLFIRMHKNPNDTKTRDIKSYLMKYACGNVCYPIGDTVTFVNRQSNNCHPWTSYSHPTMPMG
jgi:hypothetical protein